MVVGPLGSMLWTFCPQSPHHLPWLKVQSKGKVDGATVCSTHSSSPIHVSARLIQIHDIRVMGGAGQWARQKNRGMSFILSYGMAANDVAGKSVCSEPVIKMQGGALKMLLGGGFYLFGVSVLILSASLKLGICIYSNYGLNTTRSVGSWYLIVKSWFCLGTSEDEGPASWEVILFSHAIIFNLSYYLIISLCYCNLYSGA